MQNASNWVTCSSKSTEQALAAQPRAKSRRLEESLQTRGGLPLAEIDVHAGNGQRVDGVSVGGNNRHVVVLKADREVRQRARVDHADPVGLAGLHSHILALAACHMPALQHASAAYI